MFSICCNPSININSIDKYQQRITKIKPLIIIIGMILIFLQLKKIGINLNLIIKM